MVMQFSALELFLYLGEKCTLVSAIKEENKD